MKISACILTYNCASKVERLLKSLDFVDEIVIVDDMSTDNTLEIVKKFNNTKIFSKKLTNFGEQKNFSIEKASNDWVLVIDSDEEISKNLKEEILNLSDPAIDGYYIPRYTFFLGKPIRHSGWYPDYNIRLFNRKKTRFENSIVHEKVIPTKNMGYLKNALKHYSYDNLGDYFFKLRKYTQMQTERSNIPETHLNIIYLFLKPFYRFFKMYFLNLGVLDGWRGLLLAVLSSYYDFKVHLIAEKKILKKNNLFLWLVGLAFCFFQVFLIYKLNYLAGFFSILLVLLSLLFLNFYTSLFVLIFSTALGQVARIYLSGGGGIVLSDLIAPVFLLNWVAFKLIKSPKFVKSPIDKSLFLLIAIIILTYVLAVPRYFEMKSAFYLFRLISYLMLFWPIYDIINFNKKYLGFSEILIRYLFYTIIFLGVLQMIFMPYLIVLTQYGWDPHLNRLVSSFLDPNFLAAFLVIGFSYFLAQYYSSKENKIRNFVPVLIIAIAIIMTFSRSGYLMLFIVLAFFALLRDWRIIIVGFLGFMIMVSFVPRFSQRIIGGFNIDESAQFRFESWNQGYQLIEKNMYFGVGYNNLVNAKKDIGILEGAESGTSHGDSGIDSSIMAIWSTTGLVGLIIFLIWYFQNVVLGLKAFFRSKNAKVKNFGLAMAAFMVGLFFHSFFVNSILYPHILILVMIMLALFYFKTNEDA